MSDEQIPVNPNNCENCDHWKTQRVIEKNDPEAMKLHCYHFREPYLDVCMQHTGRNMMFLDSAALNDLPKNFPISSSLALFDAMVRATTEVMGGTVEY